MDELHLDAGAVAQIAQRMQLISEHQLRDCWEELGRNTGSSEEMLQIMERRGYLTPLQSSKLRKGDRDGFLLGGYRLLYKIASGSFGRVYRADDPRTGAIVAIKVLRRRWEEDQHKISLFEREGKIGMTLQHPNIVELLSVSKDPATGQHFIVMEFIEGLNLREMLATRKRLTVAESLRILEESVSGLTYAYSRGLTHRDLKPSNILIASGGTSKLVDFGLGELSGPPEQSGYADADDTVVDRTVDYAGLERTTNVKTGDVRSDIYFMGAIFSEMLTGRPPLTPTRDRRARMYRSRFENAKPVRKDEIDGPYSVVALCEKMMQLDPHQRFQTPSQLLDAVRNVQADLAGGVTARGPEGPKTIYIVESNVKLQEAIRDEFKQAGFRVLMASDPTRALERYESQPYHALIIDAGSVGEEGSDMFCRIVKESQTMGMNCAAVMILNPEQAYWAERVPESDRAVALVRPVTLKQLRSRIGELMPEE
jgi:serine/threonine protein kinase